jgi:hypothetical protein
LIERVVNGGENGIDSSLRTLGIRHTAREAERSGEMREARELDEWAIIGNSAWGGFVRSLESRVDRSTGPRAPIAPAAYKAKIV